MIIMMMTMQMIMNTDGDNSANYCVDDNGGGQNLVVMRIQVKFHFGNVFSSRVVAPIALVPKAESHDYDNDDGGRPDTDPCHRRQEI